MESRPAISGSSTCLIVINQLRTLQLIRACSWWVQQSLAHLTLKQRLESKDVLINCTDYSMTKRMFFISNALFFYSLHVLDYITTINCFRGFHNLFSSFHQTELSHLFVSIKKCQVVSTWYRRACICMLMK